MAADRLGFTSGLLADEHLEAAVADLTGGDGFDVVFDATGYRASMERAFRFVAHGGALVLVSVVKEDITFSDPEFHKREMMLIGSRNATRVDFDHVRKSIADGLVPIDQLITIARRWQILPRICRAGRAKKSGLIKALIQIG